MLFDRLNVMKNRLRHARRAHTEILMKERARERQRDRQGIKVSYRIRVI